MEIYIFKKIGPFLTYITAYFPFSLFWRNRRYHHRFKEITEADDLIIETASQKGFWFRFLSFERDEKLLIIFGKFIRVEKGAKEENLLKHFEATFANKNVFISKPNSKTVKFSFIRIEKNKTYR